MAITFRLGGRTFSLELGGSADIDRDVSCGNKLQHASEEAAEKAAASFSKKKGEPFEAYKCRHCDGWHVGRPKFTKPGRWS